MTGRCWCPSSSYTYMKNRRLILFLFILGTLLAWTALCLTYFTTGRIEWLRLLTFLVSGILAYVVYRRK